jgi:uncharacterized protein DUF4301
VAREPLGRKRPRPPFQIREGLLNRNAQSPDSVFSDRDREQLRARGISEERALAGLRIFRAGQKHTHLERPCTLNDGIMRLSPAEMETLSAGFAEAAAKGRVMGFVPASGAATRMFKGLVAILNRADAPAFAALAKEASQGGDAKETADWFNGLRNFPFYPALCEAMVQSGLDPEALYAAKEYRPFLQALLGAQGIAQSLRYAERPKALIPFHRYPPGPRTSLEEHLEEAVGLVQDAQGICRLHLTVSPEHEHAIHATLEAARRKYEGTRIRFSIGLSQQKPSTDTLAADQDNAPLRNPDGSLAFRPGGHGALLENLFHTGGDIVFIKNIDNVVPDRLRPTVLAYRRALGGCLVRMQERVFAYLKRLRESPGAEGKEAAGFAALVDEAAHFAEQRLGSVPPEAMRAPATDAAALAAKAAFVIKTLDRPLRVCAMVRNQGEPGGGPFWVRAKDGGLRPQIVESAQVDLASSQQRKIMESATHFNPVDLVCGLRNGEGEQYKLQDFVDTEAYFITAKSKDGKTIKALELPGLWNGSMAFWNTLFVEVPVETFNPVKTVNDLLRPNHQG